MAAKEELFDRLQFLASATSLPDLVDQGIAPSEHNGRANLLRKGLSIVAFNILEDFIKNKSFESLSSLSNSRIQFVNLTPSLREASTLGALAALLFRARIEKKDGRDFFPLIQDEALRIHSTKRPTFELSRFSLVSTGSNVGANEVGELLSAFGIKGGWTTLKLVVDRIGGGLPDPNQCYKNAADRRHNAAHSASFQYDYTWLAGLKHEILAIAAALDIALTARCRQVDAEPTKALDSHNLEVALNFRFLEPGKSGFRESIAIGGRSRKIWPSLEDALDALQPALATKSEFLVILDEGRRIADWKY